MIEQNILYELTKERTSQSMRKKGALASYRLLYEFLIKHSEELDYSRNANMRIFVWVNDRELADQARTLEAKLFSDYGVHKKKPRTIWGILKTKDFYNETFSWELDGNIEQHLTYLDNLGPLPGLIPRPAVTISVYATFRLKGAQLKSNATAWFSPTSNSVSFTLNFPHETADEAFIQFRNTLQKDCPVQLEDKYFYTRKKTKSGNSYTFRRLFKPDKPSK